MTTKENTKTIEEIDSTMQQRKHELENLVAERKAIKKAMQKKNKELKKQNKTPFFHTSFGRAIMKSCAFVSGPGFTLHEVSTASLAESERAIEQKILTTTDAILNDLDISMLEEKDKIKLLMQCNKLGKKLLKMPNTETRQKRLAALMKEIEPEELKTKRAENVKLLVDKVNVLVRTKGTENTDDAVVEVPNTQKQPA